MTFIGRNSMTFVLIQSLVRLANPEILALELQKLSASELQVPSPLRCGTTSKSGACSRCVAAHCVEPKENLQAYWTP